MFVGSVLGVVTQNKKPNPALLFPLNAVLKIATDPLSFQLPIFMHRFLWKKRFNDRIVLSDVVYTVDSLAIDRYDDMDLWRVAVYFAKTSRPCMQYGSLQMMASDIHELLTVVRTMPCAHGVYGECVSCSDEPVVSLSGLVAGETCKTSFLDALRDHRYGHHH